MNIIEGRRAVIWSAVEKVGTFSINFIIQITLARLLMPSDFAVVSMLAIFISVAQVFIDGGLATVLIQKQDCSSSDYNSVYLFNIFIALFLYLIFFLVAPYIEQFYEVQDLTRVIRVYFIVLLVNSFAMISRLQLIKQLKFKKLAKINVYALVLSAIPTILLAYNGCKYWSLVCQSILSTLIMSIGYIISARWRPDFRFSLEALKSLMPFGIRVFVVDLFNSIYNNLYNLLIGKRYQISDVGYYDRGKSLASMGPIGFSDFFMRALYPIQSKIQSQEDLNNSYNRSFEICCLFILPLSVFVSVFSTEVISFLYGEKWLQADYMVSIMCLGFMLYPLHSLNVNILKVKARGDFLLKSEVFKKIIGILLALILIRFNIRILIIGWLLSSIIDFLISEVYLYKLSGFTLKKSLMKFVQIFLVSISLALLLKFILMKLISNTSIVLLLGVIVFAFTYLIMYGKRIMNNIS